MALWSHFIDKRSGYMSSEDRDIELGRFSYSDGNRVHSLQQYHGRDDNGQLLGRGTDAIAQRREFIRHCNSLLRSKGL